MKVHFEKWEGLGNDFIVLHDVLRDLGRELDEALVRRLCDRRFGIGADGVLLVETSPRPRMIVRNADGSRPEMCGNGLRCVVGHLAGLAVGGRLAVATDAGEKACVIVDAGDGRVDVIVDMGVARRGEDLVANLGGREHRFATVDMGNPHAITFEAYEDREVDVVGPAVEKLPVGGTNVEFCRAASAGIDVTVWERGVGRTPACGTGACAVAAAACEAGRARFGQPVVVRLPGGALEITVDEATRAVTMRGPARRVFTGEVVLA